MKGFVQIFILIVFFRALAFGQILSEDDKKSFNGKNFPGYKLVVSNDEIQSEAKILFIEGMTLGLDPSWDIGGYGFDENFRLYTKLIEDNGHEFYVQCLPDDNYSSYSIPVGFNFTDGGNVNFKLEVLNDLTNECLAIFEDKETGAFVDLRKKENNYSVSLPPNSQLSDRFVLHTFDPRNKSLDLNIQYFENVKVYSLKNEIRIHGNIYANSFLELYNISGQLVQKSSLESGNSALIPTHLEKGIYLCRLLHDTHSYTVKLYLE